MEVKFAVVCDYANVSMEGKLNIMGIFSDVYVVAFPAALPPLFLVMSYEASPVEAGSEKSIRIVLSDQDGLPVGSVEQVITIAQPDVHGRPITLNQVVRLDTLRAERPGPYAFNILVNGDAKGSVPLYVQPTPQGGTF